MNTLINYYAFAFTLGLICLVAWLLSTGSKRIKLTTLLIVFAFATAIATFAQNGGVIYFGSTPLVTQSGYTWVSYKGNPYKVLNSYVPRWLAMGATIIR